MPKSTYTDKNIQIVIENNIFSKNKSKDGEKSKNKGGGAYALPIERVPVSLPEPDTIYHPFVNRIKAEISKDFYNRRFNEYNPYNNFNSGGFNIPPQIENEYDDDDDDFNTPSINTPEEDEVQDVPTEPLVIPPVSVGLPDILFDENGKWTGPRNTPEEIRVYNYHKNRRGMYITGRVKPQRKTIEKYGLQNYLV